MNRRDFTKIGGLTIAGTGLNFNTLLKASDLLNSKNIFQNVDIAWKIYDNGTYDLILPEINLTACIPSLNNKPINPVKVSVSRNKNGGLISYYLIDETKIEINLKKDEKGASLSSKIISNFKAPHFFYPISQATIEGADRFFKQGMGFAGPSGFFEFNKPKAKIESAVLKEEAWCHDSCLVSGFLSKTNTLVMGAHNHTQFLQRSTFYNRQHRFGLIDRHLNDNENLFEAGFSTEEINIDGEIQLPELFFSAGTDVFSTFRQKAKNIAEYNNVKLPHEPRYYYCSWYDKGADYTMIDLEDFLNGLNNIKPKIPIQTIQIDAGYSYMGEWLISNEHFPQGMEKAFNAITKAGYSPGIWIGPFMVNSNSFIYKEHKDWLLKDKEGNIIMEMKNDYHAGGSVHVLDTSHTEAFEYLRKVFKQMHAWGVTTYKTDFMDWGLRDSTTVTRYTPGKTGTQYFTEVVEMIREEIGEESYWLGCIAPFQPLIGKVDAVRVSNDVGNVWNMETTGNMVKEMFADHYLNNILWQNDPDVLYNRTYNTKLNESEKLLIAYYDGIMGGVVNTSDNFSKLSSDELKLWRFSQVPKEKSQALLPFWGTSDKDVFAVVREYPDSMSYGILILNISNESKSVTFPMNNLIGKDKAFVFEWAPARNSPLGQKDKFEINLDKQSCKLFYVAEENIPPAVNLSISGIKVVGLM